MADPLLIVPRLKATERLRDADAHLKLVQREGEPMTPLEKARFEAAITEAMDALAVAHELGLEDY